MRLRSTLLIPLFSALLCSLFAIAAPSKDEQINAIAKMVNTHDDWLAQTDICPVDLMPLQISRSTVRHEHCAANPAGCASRCQRNDGKACYWLAYEVQSSQQHDAVAETLFQRACQLGVPSGCTNRAAGMMMGIAKTSPLQQCVSRTFAAACEKDDPWGCSMYAYQLHGGLGVPKDDAAALLATEKSCLHGPTDPACKAAIDLRNLLKAAQSPGSLVQDQPADPLPE